MQLELIKWKYKKLDQDYTERSLKKKFFQFLLGS